MSALDRDLKRYAKLRAELPALERRIKQQAAIELRKDGLLAVPHIDVLLRRVRP